mmetsp:Transcript_25974/g.78241  ORF Transcript_25974/g.78241 Transcript_25974/m.78241 type:complete len:628 (+) Transcript_25974:735-2618(+)
MVALPAHEECEEAEGQVAEARPEAEDPRRAAGIQRQPPRVRGHGPVGLGVLHGGQDEDAGHHDPRYEHVEHAEPAVVDEVIVEEHKTSLRHEPAAEVFPQEHVAEEPPQQGDRPQAQERRAAHTQGQAAHASRDGPQHEPIDHKDAHEPRNLGPLHAAPLPGVVAALFVRDGEPGLHEEQVKRQRQPIEGAVVPLDGAEHHREDVRRVEGHQSVGDVPELADLRACPRGLGHLHVSQHEAAEDEEELRPCRPPGVAVEVAHHDLRRSDPPWRVQRLESRRAALRGRRSGLADLVGDDRDHREGENGQHGHLLIRGLARRSAQKDGEGAVGAWHSASGLQHVPVDLEIFAGMGREVHRIAPADDPTTGLRDRETLPQAGFVEAGLRNLRLHLHERAAGRPQCHVLPGVDRATVAAPDGEGLHPRPHVLVSFEDQRPPRAGALPTGTDRPIVGVDQISGVGDKLDVVATLNGVGVLPLDGQGLVLASQIPTCSDEPIVFALYVHVSVQLWQPQIDGVAGPHEAQAGVRGQDLPRRTFTGPSADGLAALLDVQARASVALDAHEVAVADASRAARLQQPQPLPDSAKLPSRPGHTLVDINRVIGVRPKENRVVRHDCIAHRSCCIDEQPN